MSDCAGEDETQVRVDTAPDLTQAALKGVADSCKLGVGLTHADASMLVE